MNKHIITSVTSYVCATMRDKWASINWLVCIDCGYNIMILWGPVELVSLFSNSAYTPNRPFYGGTATECGHSHGACCPQGCMDRDTDVVSDYCWVFGFYRKNRYYERWQIKVMAYSREEATRLIDYNAGVNTIVSYYFATTDCFCVKLTFI